MSLVLDEHRQLLDDDVRLRTFEAALADVVQPHHVVLDLASGTGILGLLAFRAGARRVYSVDDGSIVQMARDIARANGASGRLITVKAESTRVEIPELADIVVADQIGQFGFEPGIVKVFADARRRLLKPGGVLMPSRIDLVVAPVSAPDIWDRIDFWRTPRRGIDLTAALPTALNTGYPIKLRSDQVLGTSTPIATLDLTVGVPDSFSVETSLEIEKEGTMHGIGGWFAAQLSDRVKLTNSPLAADTIRRRNVVFPIAAPVHVRPGLVVNLSPWGVARRTVLELCDGRRTSAEIEVALRTKHADLFPTPAKAALFVAEVVVPYSR